MITKVIFGGVCVLTLISSGALADEEQPETVAHAILRAIDLFAGNHVFDRGETKDRTRPVVYFPVTICGERLPDDSIKVPPSVGNHTLYIVDEHNAIEDVMPGR